MKQQTTIARWVRGDLRHLLMASAVLVALGGPGSALAAPDQMVVVAAPWTYSPTPIHVPRNQTLTFANLDNFSGEGHSLTQAVAKGTEQFTSPIIPFGTNAKVTGVEKLSVGTYRFACRVHPFMGGTLVVE